MSTYHIVTFDHYRAAETLFNDLNSLQVSGVTLDAVNRENKSDGGVVAVEVPEGTNLDNHMEAVKAISLGRGSHTVERSNDPRV